MPVRFLSPAHYESYGQYNGSPSPTQLARYFYLDDFDRHHIGQRRRALNRLGFDPIGDAALSGDSSA